MPSTRDMIYALAKKNRSRKNLEAIQEMLTELGEFADDAESAMSAAAEAREKAQELRDALDNTASGNPLMEWADDLSGHIDDFLLELPEDELQIAELVQEANGYAEEYESCLEDSDYSADDREEVWGNLCNALTDIADVMS